MRFYLILFMNLAAIASTGTLGNDTLLSELPIASAQYCPRFVGRLKKFKNCDVPSTFNSIYTETALPYICLLSLNTIMEICREDVPRLQDTFDAPVETMLCPFSYATKSKNLDLEVSKAVNYFRNKKNCEAVCNLNEQTLDDCKFMTFLNKEVMRLYEKGERVDKQSVAQPPLQQNKPENGSKQIFYDQRQKAENARGPVFETKAEDPIINHGERVNKTAVNMEETSGNETRGKEEKTSNATIGGKPKPVKTGESSKEMKYKYKLNVISSGLRKILQKGVSNKVIAHVNNNGSNNKIDDNIQEHTPDSINNNKNKKNNKSNNKEVEGNIGDGLNVDKVHLAGVDVPSEKALNDEGHFSTSTSKKDYTYVSTIKTSVDGADDDDDDDDDDTNGDILGNHQKQDVPFNKEYESGRVLNRKELYNGDGLFQAEDSHFSVYFLMSISIIIIGYITYHNKNKIVAYALEGRRGRSGRRRRTSASYRKLDCNLEEAIASNPSHASVTSVVY